MRLAGIMVAIAAGVVLAGCAFHDAREDYAFSGANDGLWGDTRFDLVDWNFPTTRNQPPIEVPKRLHLDRTAIGVTWATHNPLPLTDNLAPVDAPPALEARPDDAAKRSPASAATRTAARGSSAADREPRAAR